MIAALICGRADGPRFPGRNTFPLFGRPLMVYATLAALHAEEVDHVFLTSEDEGMKTIARHHGVETIDRPPALSGDQVPLEDVVQHGYAEICKRLKHEPEALVVLLANAPTVASGQIDHGVRILRADNDLDAVISASSHDEFHPSYALRVAQGDRLVPYADGVSPDRSTTVYFPDALLWVLRPSVCASLTSSERRDGWIVDVRSGNVAALVHEGYGDVDYSWQVPLVEEWLRRRGFDESSTPYDQISSKTGDVSVPRRSDAHTRARRVLITTVPFGLQPRPLERLQTEGIEYVINPIGRRLKEDELAQLIRDFDVVIAGTEPITARVMDGAGRLQLISRVGIGLDRVDLPAARARGIQVSYTPEAPSPAVAELTIGLMLALLRDIPATDRVMRQGVWRRSMGRRLSAMTVGVVGVGRIGKRVIRHLVGGFHGVRILANDLQPDYGFG